MDEEVRESIKIGIELIICAAIISIIATTLWFGNSLVSIRNAENASAILLEEQANLYKYSNTEITGSDVVDLIVTYARIYDFVVVDKVGSSVNKIITRTSANKLEDWTVESINSGMESYLYNKYNMRQILTADGGSIQAIILIDSSKPMLNDKDIEDLARDLGINNFKTK